MDDKIKELLQDLGSAINDSVSNSAEVNQQIQRLRDAGCEVYVVLDATIGINHKEGEEVSDEVVDRPQQTEVQFRINVNDLAMLRGLGIDPTRKVKRSTRRVSTTPKTKSQETENQEKKNEIE